MSTRYNPQKLEYGETFEAVRDIPQAPQMLPCIKCDSFNTFLVWPRDSERVDVNLPLPPKSAPADPRASRPHSAEQLALAFEAVAVRVVFHPASPQAQCRECGCGWYFDWQQCPDLKLLRAWLWAESQESLAVIGALKAFVCMPETEDEEKALEPNRRYSKYYNMLTYLRFGAAPTQPSPENDTDTNAKKLPGRRQKAGARRATQAGQTALARTRNGRR